MLYNLSQGLYKNNRLAFGRYDTVRSASRCIGESRSGRYVHAGFHPGPVYFRHFGLTAFLLTKRATFSRPLSPEDLYSYFTSSGQSKDRGAWTKRMPRHEVQSTSLFDLSLPIYAPVAVRLMEACESKDDTEVLRWIGLDPGDPFLRQ